MRTLRIDHQTRLSYTEPVTESLVELRMSPASTEEQAILGLKIKVVPHAVLTTYRDGFGNRVDFFNLIERHSEIVISAASCVRLSRKSGADRLADLQWSPDRPIDRAAREFTLPSDLVIPEPEVIGFCEGVELPEGPLAGTVERMMAAVHERIVYEPRVTDFRSSVAEVLALGRGVCQDFAHLFLALARSKGLPARYVSGYIHEEGELATHAWVQVWGGPVGWVDVDPTHRCWVGDGHVTTAVGRDFRDVPPNRGAFRGGAEETIEVSVNVTPVDRVPPELVELSEPPAWAEAGGDRRHRRARPERQGPLRQQQSQQQQ